MRIGGFKSIPGPNIYSYDPVLVMKLYLDDLVNTSSAQLPSFTDRLLAQSPGLREHRCSEGQPGGFVMRMREGTYCGHIVEHVALELSGAVGIPVGFGKTRYAGESTAYNVIVECPNEAGMRSLLEISVALVEALIKGESFPLEERLRAVRRLVDDTELGPSTREIVKAAQRRGIPWLRLNQGSLVQLGYGKHRKLIEAAMADTTSAVAVEVVSDKQLTKALLERAFIPVPRGETVKNEEEAVAAWQRLGEPVVVKPLNGSQGQGVSLNLNSEEEIRRAFKFAHELAPNVLIEELYRGKNYRVLVVNGKMIAASERLPTMVVGDGVHTIAELVDMVNQDPRRGEEHTKPLTRIVLDKIVMERLTKYGMTPEQIPAKDEQVILRESANLSTGGTAIDVTDRVHPETIKICERAARIMGLDLCGVDLVADDISQLLESHNGILELNASPGLRMHVFPSEGQSRPVGDAIINLLFPRGKPTRIPIVSITGTNGKTTVTRMIGHILSEAGHVVGMTSTHGVSINCEMVTHGDDTGPRSAQIVLCDPLVEIAVLETARGGIARSGLGYDWSDVGVITNIQADHIGQDGIESIDDLIYIKSLVAERVKEHGTLILNADDENVRSIVDAPRVQKIKRQIVYLAQSSDNPYLERHRLQDKTVFFEQRGWIVEAHSYAEYRIVQVAQIPVTLGGQAHFNIMNAIAAVAACRALGVSRERVASGIVKFLGLTHNEGRANLYRVASGYVLLDYGHNAHAFQAIAQMAAEQQKRRVTGVITVPGDRADRVLEQAGQAAARGFDRIIVREDHDLRGRQPGEIARLLQQAIQNENPKCDCTVVLDEEQSFAQALQEMQAGELVVMFYDSFEKAQRVLEHFGAVPVDDAKEYALAFAPKLEMVGDAL
ncbi:MAG: cyanophycin synthetase [Nitrospirae bacterium]|nr:cyanophycin synthetase [Nitrospirota bacterium]